MAKLNLLVLCTGNSARSPMAAAFIKEYGEDRFHIFSAGTDPRPVSPSAVKVMKEIGIDISSHTPTHFEAHLGRTPVHVLIVLSSESEHRCASIWPGVMDYKFWPTPDPSAAIGSEEQKLEAYRQVRDQLKEQIKAWTRESGVWLSQIRKKAQLV